MTWVAPVIASSPALTAKATATPLTRLPSTSLTTTAGAIGRAAPGAAHCPSPACAAILAAAPALRVTLAVALVRPAA